jgi:hypothetical protein
MNNEIEELKSELRRLTAELAEIRKDRDNADEQFEAAVNDIRKLTAERDALKADVEDARLTEARNAALVGDLRARLEQAEGRAQENSHGWEYACKEKARADAAEARNAKVATALRRYPVPRLDQPGRTPAVSVPLDMWHAINDAALTAQPAGDDYPMPHPHLAGSPQPAAIEQGAEVVDAPEAPEHWNNTEATAWQSGWATGYAAAQPRSTEGAEKGGQVCGGAEP